MVRIAIVEDEKIYAEQLTNYLRQYEREQGIQFSITHYQDGEDIVENYGAEFDLILMDVQMQFMDGMTAASKIRALDEEVMIIFITNMSQYAIRGYEVGALDYILKPVSFFALSKKLDRALRHIKRKKKYYLLVPISEGIQKIDITTIYYIESQGHNITYYTKIGIFTTRSTISEMEQVLEKHGFFRCQKGYLVNLQYVEGIRNGSCIVAGKAISLSRPKKNSFLEAMTNYISEVQA
ncbi:MAG: LytTR family DNA-binding domain-containing protein [Lachnospiraceae bacterium]|nr:LytTR family DNA-binding domain-containing protein [Lachnospiraceae bacterium]MDD3617080.1 LytTR family DNA-binding domain-containing protein [Lachnospiraceae bacterium]